MNAPRHDAAPSSPMPAKTLREVCGAGPDARIAGIADDSRRVAPGDLFLAYAGATDDGHDHAAAAVARGAAAICSERALRVGVPNVVMPDLRLRRGELAARFFDDPSAELSCIGITGTNGKTSIAHFCATLLPDAACIGTLGWGTPPRLEPTALTTESAVVLQSRLHRLRQRGCKRVAIEASSHALDQGRVADVRFNVATFSNLSSDHLDYHGTMTRYKAAKRKLFEMPGLRAAALNLDDPWGRRLRAELTLDTLGYGSTAAADVSWSNVVWLPDGVAGEWRTPWGRAAFRLPLFGAFSIANAAAALASACLAGEPFDAVAARMGALRSPPGRMQRLAPAGGAGPTAIIDYAHTPAALCAALTAAKRHLAGSLACVFGCGGERDRGKRALMARAAERGADAVFLTSDNPRGEAPEAIMDDALQGFDAPEAAWLEADRAAAIRLAIARAGPSDAVLIAGKGHEAFQEVAGKRLRYSDFNAVRAAFQARGLALEEDGDAAVAH